MKRYLYIIILLQCVVLHAFAHYNVSPYAYCMGDPVNKVDVDGCDTLSFVLQENGNIADFSSRLKADGDHIGLIYDTNGSMVSSFTFAYQDDAESFDEETMGSVILVGKSDIKSIISNVPNIDNLFFAFEYARREGKGTMDYVSNRYVQGNLGQYGKNALFMPIDGANAAHNAWNFGNYLWGASMGNRLHIPYPIAVSGAHLNNWFCTDVAADRGHLDSFDDQYSISLGFYNGNKFTAMIQTFISYMGASYISSLFKK